MPALLRKTDKRRWDWKPEDLPWLVSGRFPAAPLGDLRTGVDSALSVWFIEQDRSNLDRIVAGLAAKLQHPEKFDFALFDIDALQHLGIRLAITRGDSHDREANERWHRELIELDLNKLTVLSLFIYASGVHSRFDEERVGELIVKAVEHRRIDKARLDARMREALFP